MCCDTGFVVGAAAAVQAPVTLGRLERRRVPLLVIALRLYVVMGVQQHGGGTGRRRMAGDHGGSAAFADDLHIAETRL